MLQIWAQSQSGASRNVFYINVCFIGNRTTVFRLASLQFSLKINGAFHGKSALEFSPLSNLATITRVFWCRCTYINFPCHTFQHTRIASFQILNYTVLTTILSCNHFRRARDILTCTASTMDCKTGVWFPRRTGNFLFTAVSRTTLELTRAELTGTESLLHLLYGYF